MILLMPAFRRCACRKRFQTFEAAVFPVNGRNSAMNGRADVSAATRTLVREASLALSYTPDQSGRSLRQGTTHAVALTIRTDIGRTMMGETFYAAFLLDPDGSRVEAACHRIDAAG